MTYTYHFKQGVNKDFTLLTLHGTGADEFDLLPLAQDIAGDDVSILSPRGNVNENGQLRFFKRPAADGLFDQDDIIHHANELADFIRDACVKHEINPATLYALGYSNGANMIAALLALRPEVIAGGILLRAFHPLQAMPQRDLNGKNVLVISGVMDQILPPEQGQALATMLENSGANITFKARLAGHELRREDVIDAKEWLQGLGFKTV